MKYPNSQIFKTIFYKKNNISAIRNKTPLQQQITTKLNSLNIPFPNIIEKHNPHYPPWTQIKPNFNTILSKYNKITTSAEKYKQLFSIVSSRYDRYSHMYTDGSKINGKTGASLVVGEEVYRYRLSDYASVYTAELYGILKAAEYILQSQNNNHTVFSDSLSAIQSVQNLYTKCPLTQKINDIFHEALSMGKDISIVWIPSHVGISGNEKADQAAREAATNNEIAEPKITTNDIKCYIKGGVMQEWENQWQQITNNNKLRSIKYTVKPWPMPTNRRQQTAITRLRIGHTKRTHTYILQNFEVPMCQQCNVQVTVPHVITDCNVYNTTRSATGLPTNIAEALHPDWQSELLQYITETNLITEF